MKRCFLFLLIILLTAGEAFAQPCPAEGNGESVREKDLNRAKNRSVAVQRSMRPQSLSLSLLISSRKREDSSMFFKGAYVVTEGYLISFEEEGPESCNCGQASGSRKDGDVHMFLGLKPEAAKKDCIVIEITPAFKKAHPGYEQYLKKGHKIRVSGFLLYDYKHRKDAFYTCKACTNIWRKTCWEIHPITGIAME